MCECLLYCLHIGRHFLYSHRKTASTCRDQSQIVPQNLWLSSFSWKIWNSSADSVFLLSGPGFGSHPKCRHPEEKFHRNIEHTDSRSFFLPICARSTKHTNTHVYIHTKTRTYYAQTSQSCSYQGGNNQQARAVPHTGSDVCNVRTLRCALRLKKRQRTIHHRDCPSRPLAASGTWPHNHHLWADSLCEQWFNKCLWSPQGPVQLHHRSANLSARPTSWPRLMCRLLAKGPGLRWLRLFQPLPNTVPAL